MAPAWRARDEIGSASVKAASFSGIVSESPRTCGPQPATKSRNPAVSTRRAAYDQSVRPRAAYAARCNTGESECAIGDPST